MMSLTPASVPSPMLQWTLLQLLLRTSVGRCSLLAKIDIKSAYRLVPVRPSDRKWLRMQWQGCIYMYIDAMHLWA